MEFLAHSYNNIMTAVNSSECLGQISIDSALCFIRPWVNDEEFDDIEVALSGFPRTEDDKISALALSNFLRSITDFS